MNLRILACHTRAHCRACRTDLDWCERVVGVREFQCPHGVTADNLPSRGIGDAVAKQAKGPGDRFHALLAKKYGLKPCQKCNETIDLMNRLGPEGCKYAKSDIIDDIWDRRDQLRGWRSVVAMLPGSEILAKRELGRLFDNVLSLVTVDGDGAKR